MKIGDLICITTDRDHYTKWLRSFRKKGVRGINAFRVPQNNLETHLTILSNAIKKESRSTLILTDFTKLIAGGLVIPEPPKDWELLFIGGDIQRVKSDTNEHFVEAVMKGGYSYIVRENAYRKVLAFAKGMGDTTLDDLLIGVTESDSFKSYALKVPLIVDIRTPFIKKLESTPETLQNCLPAVTVQELPKVNLVTVTRDNGPVFPLTIRSFYKQNYPRELLTWVIIDNSTNESRSPKEIILNVCKDPRIRYIDNIGKNMVKVNLRNGLMDFIDTSGPRTFILHFDENVYYPPESTKLRIETFMALPEGSLLGTVKTPFYDIIADLSYTSSQADIYDHTVIPHSGSMTYDLPFWTERKFGDTTLEWIQDRFEKVYAYSGYPFLYCITATKSLPEKSELDYPSKWDPETQQFIKTIKETL